MYVAMTGGEILAMSTDPPSSADARGPRYVARGEDGIWRAGFSHDEAHALSVRGDLYALDAEREVPGFPDAPVAAVFEMDDGEVATWLGERIGAAAAHAGDLDMALLESAETAAQDTSDTQEGIVELAELLADQDTRIAALEAAKEVGNG